MWPVRPTSGLPSDPGEFARSAVSRDPLEMGVSNSLSCRWAPVFAAPPPAKSETAGRIAVYTLVNAPTIGFDLARLPTGAAVATVLLEALAVQPSTGGPTPDLAEFDGTHLDDPRRAAAWLEVSALTPQRRLDAA